jgi:hypothetical protein
MNLNIARVAANPLNANRAILPNAIVSKKS